MKTDERSPDEIFTSEKLGMCVKLAHYKLVADINPVAQDGLLATRYTIYATAADGGFRS